MGRRVSGFYCLFYFFFSFFYPQNTVVLNQALRLTMFAVKVVESM